MTSHSHSVLRPGSPLWGGSRLGLVRAASKALRSRRHRFDLLAGSGLWLAHRTTRVVLALSPLVDPSRFEGFGHTGGQEFKLRQHTCRGGSSEPREIVTGFAGEAVPTQGPARGPAAEPLVRLSCPTCGSHRYVCRRASVSTPWRAMGQPVPRMARETRHLAEIVCEFRTRQLASKVIVREI